MSRVCVTRGRFFAFFLSFSSAFCYRFFFRAAFRSCAQCGTLAIRLVVLTGGKCKPNEKEIHANADEVPQLSAPIRHNRFHALLVRKDFNHIRRHVKQEFNRFIPIARQI